MQEVIASIDAWLDEGEAVALATVTNTWGSAPRGVGAKMALTAAGDIAGSVSGGCVEGAVYEAAQEVIKSGQARLLHYGVADEEAWEVGLACGGKIDVFLQPVVAETYLAFRNAIVNNRLIARFTLIGGAQSRLGEEILVFESGDSLTSHPGMEARWAMDLAVQHFKQGVSHRMGMLVSPSEFDPGVVPQDSKTMPEETYFLEIIPPAPKIVIVGGVHIAIPLVTMAKALGYETIIIDPRRAFGSNSRFGHADRLVPLWPGEAFNEIELNATTAVVMLTHDPKIDDPALEISLPSQAFFIGALGSKKTQQKRTARLLSAGLSKDLVDRIHGPVGLNLGGREPEEIALAIMAQITAARHNYLRLDGAIR